MSSPKTAYQCSSQPSPPQLRWSQHHLWARRYRTETPISCCFPHRIDYRGVSRTDSSRAADLYSWIARPLRCWIAERFTGVCYCMLAPVPQCDAPSVRGFLDLAEVWWDIRRREGRWPAAGRGQGCTWCLERQTHGGEYGRRDIEAAGGGAWCCCCFTRLLRRSLARREFTGSSKCRGRELSWTNARLG
jgi:hypothetical protein